MAEVTISTGGEQTGSGSGSVTSVDISGGTTGLTTSGGPITSSGTITVSGTLAIANGGTGATTANAAFNALSPNTTRGDITVRNATVNARLALGAAGTILRSDGTDLAYSTATYPNTTTANQILYSSATNTLGGSANLTYDGTTFATPTSLFSTSATSPLIIATNAFTGSEPNATATNRGFTLNTRDVALSFPVPSLRPSTNNSVIALDIMPKGTPSESSGNGFAWIDVCSSDILNNNNAVSVARIGNRSDAIEFGSKIFNGAAAKPLLLSVQTATAVVPSIYVDNTGKKIGINTSSPLWNLHVHSDIAGGNSIVTFTHVNSGSTVNDGLNVGLDATGNALFLLRENLKMSFWTNATERMNISANGHLLFTTDNTLDIGASGATRPRSIYAGTSAVSPLIVGGSGTTQSLTYKTTTGVGTTGADHIFQVGNNGATEAMRILNSGLVGIGTASPSEAIDVIGNIVLSGQAYNPIFTITYGATITPDWNNSGTQKVVLNGNPTIANSSNIKSGARYIMYIYQDGSAPRTISSWGSQYKFPSGVAPTLSSSNNQFDILTFSSDGTNLYLVGITNNPS